MPLIISNAATPEIYGRRWSAVYPSAGQNPHYILVDTIAQVIAVQVDIVENSVVVRRETIQQWRWTLGDPLSGSNPTLIQNMVRDFWHARTGVAP